MNPEIPAVLALIAFTSFVLAGRTEVDNPMNTLANFLFYPSFIAAVVTAMWWAVTA